MSSYSHGGWGHFGFAANDGISLTTSPTAFALAQDATVSRSQGVPDDSLLYEMLFELSAMATSGSTPTQVIYYLARDAAGTQPLTNVYIVDIVKALLVAAATGGCLQRMEVDYHSTDPQGANGYNTVYLIALVDQGTATAAAYLSWRA